MSFANSHEEAVIIDSNETEKSDKEHNITVYSEALEKIIKKENPTLDAIREALIPTKEGKALKVKIDNEWKYLKGFDKIKTSFAKRSWDKITKQLDALAQVLELDLTNKTYAIIQKLTETESMLQELRRACERHKKSMLGDKQVYERIWDAGELCVASQILKTAFVAKNLQCESAQLKTSDQRLEKIFTISKE